LGELKYNPQKFEGVESTLIWESLFKEYERYVEQRKNFYRCCRLGEVVELIPLEGNAVLLTRKLDGRQRKRVDGDLELWLRINVRLVRKHYSCEVYSFGTVFVPSGGIEEAYGERPGSHMVSHLLDEPKVVFAHRSMTFCTVGSFGYFRRKSNNIVYTAFARFEAV
jgi:hypothetical protein